MCEVWWRASNGDTSGRLVLFTRQQYSNSGDRDGEPGAHPDRLFVAPAERVAIGGLDKPTKLAVC